MFVLFALWINDMLFVKFFEQLPAFAKNCHKLYNIIIVMDGYYVVV